MSELSSIIPFWFLLKIYSTWYELFVELYNVMESIDLLLLQAREREKNKINKIAKKYIQ